MYELNGKQYSQEQVAAAAAKTGLDVNTYIQKVGLTVVQSPIVETTGKELSQGQGAPVAENVAPENQTPSTGLLSENGSSDSQEISIEEKRALPSNVRNQISSTTGDFSKTNVAKVTAEIEANMNRPIEEKLFDGEWGASFENLGKKYFGGDGLGGQEGVAITSLKQKIGTTVEQFLVNIEESAKDFEQWQMSHESQEDRDRVAALADAKIKKRQEGLKLNYKELNRLQKAVKELPIITVTSKDAGKSFMNGIAGLIGSGATVAESVVPAMIAGTAGTLVGGPGVGAAASIAVSNSMMLGDFVTGYNTTKAKTLYPGLTEDEAIEKLIGDGESEFLKPAASAVPAMGLEAVGIKGITKYIASQKGIMKNLGGLMWAANGEGLTESFQAPLEEFNLLMAQGVDIDKAIPKAAQHFVDNFAQTYIEAAAGTLVFSGLGKGLKLTGGKALRSVSSLRASVDGGKIEKAIEELGDLNIKKVNAKTPQAREAIQLKIDDKNAELKGYIVQAASIMDFASEKNLEDISNLEDLKATYAQKVTELEQDRDIMPTEEYLDALEIYKEQYAEAKNKINKIAREVEIEKNDAPKKQQEASKKAQELYEKVVLNEAIPERNKDKAKADIVSLFEGSVNRIVRKYSNRPGFNQMKEDLTSELLYGKNGVLSMVNKYDPKINNSLGAYINTYLERRGIAIADKLLGKNEGSQFMSDVTESKTAMSEEMADASVNIREEQEAAPKQKKIAEKLNMGPGNLAVFKEAAKKVLGGKLPSVENKKALKKSLDEAFRTSLTTAIKNISGTRKAYQQFLKENWKTLYDAIPQDVVNKRFAEFNKAVIDPKTGKQKRMNMTEGTAAGELVFEKRTDVTQEEFLEYMNAKGSTKAARKNSLSEMLATQVGFDEIVDALADPEVNKKFKEIQEIQGFTVPENFEKQVAIVIDRLDQFIAKINKIQQESLKAGFIVPELSLQAIKTFAIVLKNGLKAGMSIAKAIQQAIKQASEYGIDDTHKKSIVETFNSFEDIVTVVSEDSNFKKLKSKLDKNSNAAIQRHLNILEDKLRNDIKNAANEDQKLNLIYDYLNNSLAVAKDTTSWKGVTSNEGLISYVEKLNLIPDVKSYFTVSSKALAFDSKPITSYNNTTVDVRYVRPKSINKNLKALAKKGFNNILDVFDKRNIIAQQHEFSNDLISKVAKNIVALESSLGKEFAISYLKIQQLGGESDLRLVGKIRSIQKNVEGDYTYEHTPPIEELIQSLAYTVKNSKNLESDVKDILNRSFVDVVSKTDADTLNSTGKKIQTAEKFDILNGDSIVRYEGVIDKKDLHFFDKKYNEKQTPIQKENNSIDEALKGLLEYVVPEVTDQEAKSMSRTFNEMLERKKGIPVDEIISKATAKLRGAKKGKRMKFFIPPSAEDLEGLIYALYGSGKQGDADMSFMEEKIFRPLARANNQLNAERQLVKQKFHNVVKANKGILKVLRKESNYKFYNNDSAVRVWMWTKLGYEIPGINETDKNALINAVENDPKLLKFAEDLIGVPDKQESWLKPEKDWTAGTVESELQDIVSKIGRARIFNEYIQNKNIIFSEDNLNKIEAAYGPDFRSAMEDMLYRIEKGQARQVGSNKMANAYLNWVRGAVGVTMFFNTRTALLQQLSIVNFTNWSDNNIYEQGKLVLTNPKAFAKYWTEIFNSDWMKERRQGLKTDINEAELAERLQNANNPRKALLAYVLEKGFIMTKYGDNFAVATGGAPFLYNREKTYLKQGMSPEKAKQEAFLDFQELAEKTQQSSRQDLLSNQQVSVLGRIFLAFQNTPMQMARLTKKAVLDLANNRGSKVANLSRIVYYSAIQNITFAYLQNALFASVWSDDDDEDEERRIDGKTERAINTVLDGFLRGTGIAGGVVATLKNALIRWKKEEEKGWNAKSGAILVELANVSPPIGIKARKIYGAMESYKYNKKILDKVGYDNINHPMYNVAASLGSAAFNIPLDRILTKAGNIKAMTQQDTESWQRVALFMGYSTWDLGVEDPELVKARAEAKKKGVKVPKSKFSPSFKKFGKKFN